MLVSCSGSNFPHVRTFASAQAIFLPATRYADSLLCWVPNIAQGTDSMLTWQRAVRDEPQAARTVYM
jgi:hypothetical protein